MNILITGATGFLGGYLIRELAAQFENIYIVSRKEQTAFKNYSNVKFIKGDITQLEVLNLEEDLRSILLDSIDLVLHAAALYDLSASYTDCFLQNVVGTQNILHLLKGMKNLKSFYYISTIAVGDPDLFYLEENILPKREKFSDAYSETKYLAEQFVRDNINKCFVTRIIRPGIVIGDSVTLKMEKIDGPYYFIEAFKKYSHLLKYSPIVPLSYNPKSKMPIIPVDHCAHYIKLLIERDNYKDQL